MRRTKSALLEPGLPQRVNRETPVQRIAFASSFAVSFDFFIAATGHCVDEVDGAESRDGFDVLV
jgi:hypothetical protein